ncbi:MAG TPA: aspartoacylase [Helicobacteraceae bacterium]|nr:aspartoacylase [Helicobacteraceae bacterium]
MSDRLIKKVAIVGGTHGNEFTGAYLVQDWIKHPQELQRDSFETKVIFANQRAFKEARRYIDRDLNRACKLSNLYDLELIQYEDNLAKELNQIIGPKDRDDLNVDFVVDLHTTTADMGLSLVLSHENELTWLAASYLSEKFPELHIYRWLGDEEDAFVDSLGSSGFAIEVGAVPQGVLRADLFFKTKALVLALLDFFDHYNSNCISVGRDVTIYEHVSLVDFPRDNDGNITAIVHQERQDMDFKKINMGDPLFITFDGRTINYEGSESLYGIFINEAAYYEKGFALCLARKVEYTF